MSRQLFDLTGRTALVTGANRGLGRRLALTLARAGAEVVITARRTDALAPVAKDIEALGHKTLCLELDVTDHASIRRMAAAVDAAGWKIDILVNNAGCNIRKRALDITWEDWNQVLDTNLRGAFFVAQAMAPGMIARQYGRIINIGSPTCAIVCR